MMLRSLAAEALRQAENDSQAALDVLSDPVRQGALQLGLIAQQVRRLNRPGEVPEPPSCEGPADAGAAEAGDVQLLVVVQS